MSDPEDEDEEILAHIGQGPLGLPQLPQLAQEQKQPSALPAVPPTNILFQPQANSLPELFKAITPFVESQQQVELEKARGQEATERRAIASQERVNLAALEAEQKMVETKLAHRSGRDTRRAWLVGLVIFCGAGLVMALVLTGHVEDGIKLIVGVVALVSVYVAGSERGRRKRRDRETFDDEDDDEYEP